MRTFLIISLLSLLAGCCTIGVESVKEMTDCPWQLAGSGTSFPIECYPSGAGWQVVMLTAGHVVDSVSAPLTARHRLGTILTDGAILSRHPTEDAAMVIFPSPEYVRPIPIDYHPLLWADRVIVPGYQGLSCWLVEGFASSADRCSAPMFGGGSGSPVLDRKGNVRAIVVAISAYVSSNGSRRTIPHHCHILPLFKIEEWICSELPSN